MKKQNKVKVEESDPLESKGKRGVQEYKCGDDTCGKIYHSYTAFYNHCKKSHGGEFPTNSLENGEKFQGPTKNRGRPRIKKNQVKDLVQIESMKKENELIEFMGTLDKKKSQELIVYVQNPTKRVEDAVVQVKQWLRKTSNGGLKQEDKKYLDDLEQFNKIISENDLPQFYDPIQTHNYPNKLDSYSFSSVENFMSRPEMRKQFGIKFEGKELLFKIYLCWSARMLSQSLFNEVLYLVMQFQRNLLTDRKNVIAPKQDFLKLLYEKKEKFKFLLGQFFDCLMKEHQKVSEGTSIEKKQKKDVPDEPRQPTKRKNPVTDKKFASDEGKEEDDDDDGSDNSDEQGDDDNQDEN